MLTEEELSRVEQAIDETGFRGFEEYYLDQDPIVFIGIISEASAVEFDRVARHYGWYFCYV